MLATVNQLRLFLTLCVVLTLHSASSAQGIQWRATYRQAYDESRTSGRPILLDFGTENCFWCKKMDGTTFRDPNVVALINREFVPFKVDAHQEPALTEALRVQSFPTFVMASSDGIVLGRQLGYADSQKMLGQLQGVLAQVRARDWMQRDYSAATEAIQAQQFARAIPLLNRIAVEQGERPVQQQARHLLHQIERRASEVLQAYEQSGQMGSDDQSTVVLASFVRDYDGTEAARRARALLVKKAP